MYFRSQNVIENVQKNYKYKNKIGKKSNLRVRIGQFFR